MATRKQKIKVGVFLTFCFGLIVAGIFTLGGLYENPGLHYWIDFEESVLGLYEGSMVEYLGVPVGKVSSIYVTQENRPRVEINIDPRKVLLREGVEAQLVIYSLAAGTMAISLDGGTIESAPLAPDSKIPTKMSTLTAVSSKVEGFMENLTSIAESVKAGLNGMDDGKLTAVVDNTNELITKGQTFLDDGRGLVDEAQQTVSQVRDEAQKVIEHVKKIMEKVDALAADTDTLVQNVNKKITQVDVEQTQHELQRVLDNIADVSDTVKKTLGEFDALSANVLHEADNMEYMLRQGLGELGNTFDSMRRFIEQLEVDPASLVRGKGKIEE